MKKVLFIADGFDGRGGGKIASIMENYFSKKYDTVTLIAFCDLGVFPIKGKKINIGSVGKKSFPGRGYLALFLHIFNTIKNIKNEKPDVVICIGSYCNFLGLFARKFLKFKLLLTQHECITKKIQIYGTLLDRIIFKLNKYLIGNTHIVCVSNEVMKDTVQYYNIHESSATVIYNGFDFGVIQSLSQESLDIKDKYIINIGALGNSKNQEMLLKAYSGTKCKNKYKLLLLGEGPKRELFVKLAKELNIENNVIFAGFSKNPYKYLKNASMLCFTSLSEALPTVLIESLILKVPVLTVPVIGSKEILNNGNCGIISDDWDVDNFSKLIDDYIDRDNSDLVERGYKFAEENFNILTMMQNYENLINNL